MVFVFLFLLTVSQGTGLSGDAQAAVASVAAEEDSASLCQISGAVVDAHTGKAVPYFYLCVTSQGALVEYLETDEKGRFQTSAAQGDYRSFGLYRSKRGTYIIDWEEQRLLGGRPFSGRVRSDMLNLVFRVKLWPVQTLQGRVVDQTGKAIGDVSVIIHDQVPPVKTDANGAFIMAVAPTDREFDLFAISDDEGQAGCVHLQAGATAATIVLRPTRTYQGQVRDTQGHAVGPFKFLLGLRPNGSRSDCLQRNIETRADGSFSLEGLCPRAAYYTWWFPDESVNTDLGEHGSRVIDLAGHDPNAPIEITVRRYLNAVSGTIVNVDGKPIPKAKIMVSTRHGIQASHRQHKAVYTDDSGGFTLLNLAHGQVCFGVFAKGYKYQKLWAATDAQDLRIVMRSPDQESIYQVSVVDSNGQPIPEAPLEMLFTPAGLDGKREVTHKAQTDNNGQAEFKLRPIKAEGRVRGLVRCDLAPYGLAYHSVWHKNDEQVKLVLHQGGPCWTGRIIDPHQNPIPGARLFLTSMSQRATTPGRREPQSLTQSHFSETSEHTNLGVTDTDGRFSLQRFSRHDFVRVLVVAPGFKRKEIDLSPEYTSSTEFQLDPGVAMLKGTVVEKDSRLSVTNACVELRSSDKQQREITTDQTGKFSIEDLEPGVYVPVLQVRERSKHAAYVCTPEPVIAEAGQTSEVTISIQQGITLRGQLIDAHTKLALTGKRIYLEASLRTGEQVASSSIQEDGTWEMLLPPGSFDLRCTVLMEKAMRFITGKRPLRMTIAKTGIYDNLVLEKNGRHELTLQPPTLVGKPLPDLSQLGTSLTNRQFENQSILVCFFDMQQRPSRHVLSQLTKQFEQLREKGVTVVAVQGTTIAGDKLEKWSNERDIPFPLGLIQSDEEKTCSAWGVRSLPWLILTDKDHKVSCSGFSLAELDDKIWSVQK